MDWLSSCWGPKRKHNSRLISSPRNPMWSGRRPTGPPVSTEKTRANGVRCSWFLGIHQGIHCKCWENCRASMFAAGFSKGWFGWICFQDPSRTGCFPAMFDWQRRFRNPRVTGQELLNPRNGRMSLLKIASQNSWSHGSASNDRICGNILGEYPAW